MNPLRLIRITDIRPQAISWLWPAYVPRGKLTLLDGDPEYGKSLITIDVAARLSRGRPLPDGSAGGPVRRTLFLQAEDSAEDTLRPRLEAAGADFEHVFVIGRDGPYSRPVRLPRHLRRMEELIRAESVDLVVLDPLVGFLTRATCVSNDQMVRQVLGPLAATAARSGVAVMMVRHLNKTGKQKALYRGGGSIGIAGVARSAMLVTDHPRVKGERVLAVTKANLAERPPSLAYRVVPNPVGQPVVEWTDILEMTADEALHPTDEPKQPEIGVLRAVEWLVEYMSVGARPAREVIDAALAAGISERTLERAKGPADVISKLVSEGGKPKQWMWKLREKQWNDLPDFDWPELEVAAAPMRSKGAT
jgi:AAA domain